MVKINYKKQQRINEAKRLLDTGYRLTPYDPRINTHNSPEHELAKCKMIYDLKKEGKEVYAEAIFKNGGRCDLFIPEDYKVIEILHTEKLSDAQMKEDYYPSECDIFYLTSEEVLND